MFEFVKITNRLTGSVQDNEQSIESRARLATEPNVACVWSVLFRRETGVP